jgi:hypothetical protein
MTDTLGETGAGPTQRLAAGIGRYIEKTWTGTHSRPAEATRTWPGRRRVTSAPAARPRPVTRPRALRPRHFTTSFLLQEPGRYAAVHTHEIEEIFLTREGRMVVSWGYDGEFIGIALGAAADLVTGGHQLRAAGRSRRARSQRREPCSCRAIARIGVIPIPIHVSRR